MTRLTILFIVAASGLGIGCSGHTTGPTLDGGDPDGGGVGDGGVAFAVPLLVAGPEAGDPFLQGGAHQLLWTGTQYVVLGELLSDPTPAVQSVGAHAYLRTIIPREDGFALLWLDDRSQEAFYLWYFVRIDDVGVELSPQVLVSNDVERADSGEGMVEHESGYSLIWSYRPRPDSVFQSNFDSDGTPIGLTQEIYRAENAMLAYHGPPVARWNGGELVAIWDYDRGVVLVNTAANSSENAPVVLGASEVPGRPVVAATEFDGG